MRWRSHESQRELGRTVAAVGILGNVRERTYFAATEQELKAWGEGLAKQSPNTLMSMANWVKAIWELQDGELIGKHAARSRRWPNSEIGHVTACG